MGHEPSYGRCRVGRRRLIWFQHFHKAGGTSLVSLAATNGETLYPCHRNGNPLDGRRRELPLWDYDPRHLRTFVERCLRDGITFVATEWGMPDLDVLLDYDEVRLVTVLRDPFRRLLSNYRYDVRHGFQPAGSIDAYQRLPLEAGDPLVPQHYRQDNYYCRILARLPRRDGIAIRPRHLRTALLRLSQFDASMRLEDPAPFAAMARFGWRELSRNANAGGPPRARVVLNDAARLRWRKVWRMGINRPTPIAPTFEAEFDVRNWADRTLFERAAMPAPAPVRGWEERCSTLVGA